MKLSKICISAVLSTTFLFGSVSPIMLETKGIDINKKVYEDKGLKISIKKGLYVEEKNQVNYLLTLDSKISKTIEIGKEVIELGENKKSEIVVLEVELQKFIDQIEFEQKISSRLKIIERDYELKNSIMKKEHTKNINEIKTVAKNKLLKILTYTKKLENNFVNLQNDLKILKDNTVAKSILDTKIQTISSLQNDLKILKDNTVAKSILDTKIQTISSLQNDLKILKDNTVAKSILDTKIQTIASLQNDIKTLKDNTVAKSILDTKIQTIASLQNDIKTLKDNTVAKSILDTKIQTIASLQNDLKILNNVNKIMKQKIQYVKTPQELLEELNTRVNSLPHSYDKELLTYTIEDMKQIF